MVSRTGWGGGTNEERFTEELSRLKRQGASVFVVGSVRTDQRRDICRRLFGKATVRPRRRVLVTTTGDGQEVSELVDEPATASATHSVVRYATHTRSAAASDPTAAESDSVPSTTATTLADLGIAISNAIDEFESDANGLAPAELRVGVDSLVPLVDEYGVERVFKFVHLTNGRTRDTDGMIHYHLPMDRDSDVVAVLAPLFDIVIELRERNGDFQERWSLNDGNHSSGWISVGQS